MEQNPTYHKIEAYLDNSLPAAEHEAFEREIARDPELAQQVELQRFERDAMEVLVEEDLRDDIAGWKKDMLQVYVDKNKEAKRIEMKTRRNRFLAIAASFLVILAAGVSFVFKLYEFFYDLSAREGFQFAGAHLSTYLLVAGGYFLLLAFAFLRGHFNDIEQPKHDILEEERRRDAAEYRAS